MMNSLNMEFSDADESPVLHRTENIQQARNFEARTQLNDVAGQYMFPHNLSADEYQEYMAYTYDVYDFYVIRPDIETIAKPEPSPELTALQEKMLADWNDLLALNPVLQNIALDEEDVHGLHTAIQGAVSQYNTDDINFVISRWSFAEPENSLIFGDDFYTDEELTLKNSVEEIAGAKLGWLPAPKTMQRIKLQLEARLHNDPCP